MNPNEIKTLANEMGVHESTVFRWIKRIRTPSPGDAAKLESITKIDRRAWLWPDQFHNLLIDYDHTPKSRVANGE